MKKHELILLAADNMQDGDLLFDRIMEDVKSIGFCTVYRSPELWAGNTEALDEWVREHSLKKWVDKYVVGAFDGRKRTVIVDTSCIHIFSTVQLAVKNQKANHLLTCIRYYDGSQVWRIGFDKYGNIFNAPLHYKMASTTWDRSNQHPGS